jgi:ribosomal protein S18 acetylase RimI-like enzyme
VSIAEARLPEELPVLRRMMEDYLAEFDPGEDAATLWDDEYYRACEAGVLAGTHSIAFAREGAEAIGFLITRVETMWYRQSSQIGHVEELYVKPKFRRRGTGRALVAWASERFRRRGIQTATASVLRENQAALGFWQQLGFEIKVHYLFKPI